MPLCRHGWSSPARDATLSVMNVQLTAVTEDHKDVLANLLQFYRYDFSEFHGYELTPARSHGESGSESSRVAVNVS